MVKLVLRVSRRGQGVHRGRRLHEDAIGLHPEVVEELIELAHGDVGHHGA